MIIFFSLYTPLILFLYGRQGRWYAAFGWPMVVGGIVAQGVGAGDAFPWAGLVFFGVAALGALLILFDLSERRRRRSITRR